MSRVVVTGRIPEPGLDLLRADHDVWSWESDEAIPTDVRDAQLADADAALTMLNDPVDEAFLDAAPGLQVVANVAVGYNNVDVEACRDRGVTVTNTPGVLTDATADLAMALVLAATRRLGEGERLVRSQAPWQWGMFMMLGVGLRDRQLGIVGMGEIGTALARRARAFGMSIAYHNRSPVDPHVEEELEATRLDLDDLFASSRVVSLNCPYTEATHHLVDADALAAMGDDTFLVNTARGAVVDEPALVEALRAGTIAGAGLDVYEDEPEVHPGLLDLDNVVLLPHLGSATIETRTAMSTLAARNALAVLAGDEPPTPVT